MMQEKPTPGPTSSPRVPMIDRFTDDRRAGRVIGTRNAAGVLRLGRDVERQIAIDNGALRMQPLIQPGWARQGVAYGPYQRVPGLTLTVAITNGHNTSQSGPLPETLFQRVRRWVIGTQSEPPLKRLASWLTSRAIRGDLRRLRWWMSDATVFNENLALGWFPEEAPEQPLAGGAAFVVHAAEGENGELWARVRGRGLPAFRGLQNVQVHYVIVLRAEGAAYYVSSTPGAFGLAPFPYMRPIAIDPFDDHQTLFAGCYQSVLGQIGFRVDTRVQAMSVSRADDYQAWYGSAHAADPLTGEGPLHAQPAEVGGRWQALASSCIRTERGALAEGPGALAVLDPGEPSGLVHVLIDSAAETRAAIGIIWRLRDLQNYWMLLVSRGSSQLILVEGGERTLIARDAERGLPDQATCSIQILDGHGQFGLYLDGRHLFDAWFSDPRLQDATAVGFRAEDTGSPIVRAFEAHPASVPIPQPIRFAAPSIRWGEHLVVADSFSGAAADLSGHFGEPGGRAWEKILGKGAIILTGDGAARVQATIENPNPGRLAYTVDWLDPHHADLETTIVPPGTSRGQGQKCRGGFIFWQDEQNFLTFTTYLDDDYEGASIALFSHLNGYEELYDAIWTMVAGRIFWGTPFTLRIVFDGMRFMVAIDDERILQRSLTDLYPKQAPLRITRVGLAVNWEWGDDTGSIFENFTARA